MQLKFVYPMWGSGHLPLRTFMKKIKDAGFDGVEMNIPFDKDYCKGLKLLLNEFDLLLIAQQWLPPVDETASEYVLRMEKYLLHLASFQPLFINSHTGKDFYSFEENCEIFEAAEKIAKNTGLKIVHETHRGRALFSTYTAKQYFKQFPQLRINADFSHWCCVSESLLQEQHKFIDMACGHADYIHARVGHEQGPQVNHPEWDENKEALKLHLSWWAKIIANAKNAGQSIFPVCTEFGPRPYLYYQREKEMGGDVQWELNLRMKNIMQNYDGIGL